MSFRLNHITQRAILIVFALGLFAFSSLAHTLSDAEWVMNVSEDLYQRISEGDSDALSDLFRHPSDAGAGRLNPLIRPYFLLVYSIFGRNFELWAMWNAAILVVTAQIVYTLAQRLCTHPCAPFLSAALFLCYPQNCSLANEQYLLETPSMLEASAGFLLLYFSLDESGMTAKSGIARGVGATLVVVCSVLLVGLKETNCAFVASFLIVVVVRALHASPAVRKRARLMFLSLVAVLGSFAALVYFHPLDSGAYTRTYSPYRWPLILENLDAIRVLILGAYGLLPAFAIAAFAIRIIRAFSGKESWRGLSWRAAMLSNFVVMALLVSPFRAIFREMGNGGITRGYLLNATIPFLAIFIVWELSDVWRSAKTKTNPDPSQSTSSLNPTLLALTTSILLTWSSPAVTEGSSDYVFYFKILFLLLTLVLGGVVWRRLTLELASHGTIGSGFHRHAVFWAIFSSLHLGLYTVPALLTRTHYVGRVQRIQLQALHRIARDAPAESTVFVDRFWGNWKLSEIGRHLNSCEQRPDLKVARLDDRANGFGSHYVILSWESSLRQSRPVLGPQGRKSVRFSDHACVYRYRLAQPAWLTARILGRRSGSQAFPPVFEWVDMAAVVYYPPEFQSGNPAGTRGM